MRSSRLKPSPAVTASLADAKRRYNFRTGVNDSSTILSVATLDGFATQAADARGLDLRDVEPLSTITIRTRNSVYRIMVTHATSVVIQGGHFFPDPVCARVNGSGFGGSLLKVGWIGIGLRVEIFAGDQRIVTSPVRDISIEPRGLATAH